MPLAARLHEEDTDKRIVEPVEPNLEGRSISDPAEMDKIGESPRPQVVLPFRFHTQAKLGHDLKFGDRQGMVSELFTEMVARILTVQLLQLS